MWNRIWGEVLDHTEAEVGTNNTVDDAGNATKVHARGDEEVPHRDWPALQGGAGAEVQDGAGEEVQESKGEDNLVERCGTGWS